MTINSWKKHNIDPVPAPFNYPISNTESNQDSELRADFDSYETFFCSFVLFIISNFVFNLKFMTKTIFVLYNILVILILISVLTKASPFSNLNELYIMRVIGVGLQKYISTPSIFSGSMKDKYFPQHKIFNNKFTIIKAEITGVLQFVDKIPLTHNAIPFNKYISRDYDKHTSRGWKTLAIKLEGKLTKIGILHCPKISELVNIPSIRNATISILEGKRHIPIHCGYFKGYIRYLFCVIEPVNNHAFIYINKKKYVFKENEGILWDDLFPHEVYNMSDETRVCLYLDIVREHENILIQTIIKLFTNISTFSSTIQKMNKSYEKKPISMDDFPIYESFHNINVI